MTWEEKLENFRNRFGDTFNLCVDDKTLQGEIESLIREALEAQEKEFRNSKEYRELKEKAWKYDQLNK